MHFEFFNSVAAHKSYHVNNFPIVNHVHIMITANNSVTHCATGNLISVPDRGSNADYNDIIGSGLNVKCLATDYAKPAVGKWGTLFCYTRRAQSKLTV